MNQVEELLKVVEEAQADKGNVVIVTGKPGRPMLIAVC